jgi:ParB-like nuclease family protein
MKKQQKIEKRKPVLVKIDDIHIPKKDYPASGQYPPESSGFESLKVHMKKHGQLIPIFIDVDKVLLQGHYRLWAWKEIGETFIKACVISSTKEEDQEKEINLYFD